MESLERYAVHFDAEYSDYTDARHSEITSMLACYDVDGVGDLVTGDSFKNTIALILPVIAIKNYKTQVPFPEDISGVVKAFIMVKKATVDPADRFKNLKVPFDRLEAIQGFQLPTISAVFHFSHPTSFPIVDRNVQAACQILIDLNPEEFVGYECPVIPAPRTSAENKLKKYQQFIRIIDRIMAVHPDSAVKNDYRSMDKALMVLGSSEMRKKVEGLS